MTPTWTGFVEELDTFWPLQNNANPLTTRRSAAIRDAIHSDTMPPLIPGQETWQVHAIQWVREMISTNLQGLVLAEDLGVLANDNGLEMTTAALCIIAFAAMDIDVSHSNLTKKLKEISQWDPQNLDQPKSYTDNDGSSVQSESFVDNNWPTNPSMSFNDNDTSQSSMDNMPIKLFGNDKDQLQLLDLPKNVDGRPESSPNDKDESDSNSVPNDTMDIEEESDDETVSGDETVREQEWRAVYKRQKKFLELLKLLQDRAFKPSLIVDPWQAKFV